MYKPVTSSLVACVLALGASSIVFASSDDHRLRRDPPREQWTSAARIANALSASGFHVRAVEADGAAYEIHAIDPDGKALEIEVKPKRTRIHRWEDDD